MEKILIALVIIIEVAVFFLVWSKIYTFSNFFPDLNRYLRVKEKSRGDSNLYILESEADITSYRDFDTLVDSTNTYLKRNQGTTADFSILQDMCDRCIDKRQNEIESLINVPLYVGLMGTFIGVIFGVYGLDLSASSGSEVMISNSSIQDLLNGVVFAMIASFCGLFLTVISSAVLYKGAVFKVEEQKNNYFDFIQQELLPNLNDGISQSLNSFKGILDNFINLFGSKLEDYSNNGEILNENLSLQKQVLEQINELGLTKTVESVTSILSELNNSTEHLQTFVKYQDSLNTYIDNSMRVSEHVEKSVSAVNSMIGKFDNFNSIMVQVGMQYKDGLELQEQFKNSLEEHFPTIEDHRVIWREQIDALNSDIASVYENINKYFETSAAELQGFVNNNTKFFTNIDSLDRVVQVLVDRQNIQTNEFLDLKNELRSIRTDFNTNQASNIDLNIQLIEGIKDFNVLMSSKDPDAVISSLKEISDSNKASFIELCNGNNDSLKGLIDSNNNHLKEFILTTKQGQEQLMESVNTIDTQQVVDAINMLSKDLKKVKIHA